MHRDIKPANIFVTDSGLVKIMDFGTARLAQSTQTQTGTVMGTVAYMSPEQIQGQKVDGRSDISASGCSSVCHQQPFGGENIHHIIYKILNVQPAHLVLPEGVQVPSLQHIVDRALAKDLSQRYQSADDMARDLLAFQRNQAASIAQDTVFRTLSLSDEEGVVIPQVGGPTQAVGSVTQPVVAEPTIASDAGFLEGETIKTEHLPVGKGPLAKRPEAGTGRAVSARKSNSKWWVLAIVLALVAFGVGYTFFKPPSGTGAGGVADRTVAKASPPQAGGGEGGAPESNTPAVENGQNLAEGSQGDSESPGSASGATPLETAGPSQGAPAKTTTPAQETSPPPPRPSQKSPRPETTPPSTPATTRPAPADTTAQQVQGAVDNVRAALAGGQLTQAQNLIEKGRQLDARNPIWDLLENERLVADNNLQGNTLLNQGLDHFSKGQLDAAIQLYDQALAAFAVSATLAPGHAATQQGKLNAATFKSQAITAKRQLQATAAASPKRQFTDSETSFKSTAKKDSGFVQDDRISVQEATRTTSIPGELLIELVPHNVEIGGPYLIKVRLRNKSNSALFAQKLLLVSTFKDKQIGAGQPIELGLRRIDPQSTAVLYETQDTWNEALDQGGKIEATVSLAKVGELVKTLEWSQP